MLFVKSVFLKKSHFEVGKTRLRGCPDIAAGAVEKKAVEINEAGVSVHGLTMYCTICPLSDVLVNRAAVAVVVIP